VILPCVWALTAGNGTKLKDPLNFLQLLCFYIWTPYQASLRYAYKVGRSYPAGMCLGHTLNLLKIYNLLQHEVLYHRQIAAIGKRRTMIIYVFEACVLQVRWAEVVTK
jgi:hypothetical protein